MRVFIALATVVTLACGGGKTGERPKLDTAPNGVRDTLIVDSSEAIVFRYASFGVAQVVDSSTYTISYVRVQALGPLDTVQVWFRRDSALNVPKVSTSKYFRTLRGSATFKVVKIYNMRATYRACARVRSNGQISSDMCQIWTTNHIKPPPGPVDTVKVDSTLAIRKIDIKPDVMTLKPRQTQQFCGFIVFKDGQVAIRAQEKAITECTLWYTEFPVEKRRPSMAQQIVADRTCIRWKATGGTISAEVCQTPNPLTVPI